MINYANFSIGGVHVHEREVVRGRIINYEENDEKRLF